MANCSAGISMEKIATGIPARKATCSAIFMANVVLPIAGRPATTINSPGCIPFVKWSRSVKPVGTPVTMLELFELKSFVT